MKKLFALLVTLLVSVCSITAQQRLAIFKSGADDLLSICIDAFADAPSGQSYGQLGRNSYNPGHIFDDIHTPPPTVAREFNGGETRYFGPATNNASPPAHYKKFLDDAIADYKVNSESLYDLQDKVWAYNAMDQLGYIKRTELNQVAEFNRARRAFATRYDLGTVPTDADELAWFNTKIKLKAQEVFENRRAFISANVENFRFSENAIRYDFDGVSQSMTPHFNGVEFAEISSYAATVKTDIRIFARDYALHPDRVEFKVSPANNRNYHFVFSFEDDPWYTMRFVHTNNSGTMSRTLQFDLAYGPILEPKNKRYAFSVSW